jgi:hypothetical protein
LTVRQSDIPSQTYNQTETHRQSGGQSKTKSNIQSYTKVRQTNRVRQDEVLADTERWTVKHSQAGGQIVKRTESDRQTRVRD